MGKAAAFASWKTGLTVFTILFATVTIYNIYALAGAIPVPQTTEPPEVVPPPTNTTLPPPVDTNFSNPYGLGPKEAAYYDSYLTRFVKLNGAAVSNVVPVGWCPNSCIGCDSDVTSEAVGRSLGYSAITKDKPIVDRYTRFYWMTEKHPGTDHMMWKVAGDGSVGSCGGQNSAVDGELEAIEGLQFAKANWQTDLDGHAYSLTQRTIMDSLKDGIVTTTYGKTLPHCMYPTSNDPTTAKALPCNGDTGTPMVYIGYLNLPALKDMAAVDSATWQPVYLGSREIVKNAFQDGGIYTTYYIPAPAPVCTPTTEVCDQKDNDCDGQVDENNVCVVITPTCTPTTEICDQKDNNCNGQIDENNICTTNPIPKISNLALSCTGGTVTTDTTSGGCRTIVCGTKQVLACDKPDGAAIPTYFEMYKQAGTGTEKVCLGTVCMTNEGYVKGTYSSSGGTLSVFSRSFSSLATTATAEWGTKEFFVHNLWVLKHACEDGLCTAGSSPKALYDLQKLKFYSTQPGAQFRVYEGFEPGKGPVADVDGSGDTAVFAYAETLETAIALGDRQFAEDLIKEIQVVCARDVLGEGAILCNPDNYGNIVTLQAFAGARNAGYTVG